jgi:hypothetical protein
LSPSSSFGVGTRKIEIFQAGGVSQQNGSERIDRLVYLDLIGVGYLFEARLRDVVDVAEEHFVAGEIAPVPDTEHIERPRDLGLDAIEMRGGGGVDRGDDMHARRPVERRRPVRRRARSEIAEFQRAFGHPLDKFGRERREMFLGRSQSPKPFVGQADVEARIRLLGPGRLSRDPGNVGVFACGRGAEKTPRRRAVNDLEYEMAYEVAAIAAQNVALKVLGFELRAHQPTPNLRRTCAAEKPG